MKYQKKRKFMCLQKEEGLKYVEFIFLQFCFINWMLSYQTGLT